MKILWKHIKHCWEQVYYSIGRPLWWLKRRSTREGRALLKEAVNFEPWDWAYLMNLERAALVRMAAFHERARVVEGWEQIVRDMKICIRLIDIITEDTELTTGFPDYKFCRAFNYKNMGRWATKGQQVIIRESPRKELFMETVYRQKAEYLYHKIRAEREQTWWD